MNTSFDIQVAGRRISIQPRSPLLVRFFRGYECNEPGEILISNDENDIVYEREKSRKEDLLEGIEPREFSEEYLEFIAVHRKLSEALFDYNTLLFHGSVVAVDGEAYLFTAKSGTGKSTHTRLWREVFGDRAVMVNDDKPFLEITENGVYACGSPWNGKHGLGSNLRVPLKAICILGRGTENQIRQIQPKDALFMLLQQSNRPRNPRNMAKYMELVDRLSVGVGLYKLACNISTEAVEIAYNAMHESE